MGDLGMDVLEIAGLVLCFVFPHVYGMAENRLFREHGDYLPGRHFRIYHLYLALLFGANAFLAYALSHHFALSLWLLIYSPLALDWVWWAIRYLDFKRDPAEAAKSYGEPNAWHLRSDWDNYGGFPLLFRCYLWWWLFAALLAALAAAMLFTMAVPVVFVAASSTAASKAECGSSKLRKLAQISVWFGFALALAGSFEQALANGSPIWSSVFGFPVLHHYLIGFVILAASLVILDLKRGSWES